MNGRRGIMKIEEFYGEKGKQMKVSFEWRKGKNDDFAAVSSHEISRTFEYKMGTAVKIWIEA